MQSFVRIVTNENYESFTSEEPNKNKILLFTDRKSTAPLFKSLSKSFKDRLLFGEIRKDEKELFTKFKIDKTPTILSLTNA